MLNPTKTENTSGYEINLSASEFAGTGSRVIITNTGPGEVSLEEVGSPFPHLTAEHAIEVGAALILTALSVKYGKPDEDGDHTLTMRQTNGVDRSSYITAGSVADRTERELDLVLDLIRWLGADQLAVATQNGSLAEDLRKSHDFLSAAQAAAIAATITARSAE